MKTILYLGTDPKRFLHSKEECSLIHYPVIQIVPRAIDDPQVAMAYRDLPFYTHILFTSKNAVRVFFEHVSLLKYDTLELAQKMLIAIGTTTADALSAHTRPTDLIAQEETQEGLIALLQQYRWDDAYFLLPRSSLSRPILLSFLQEKKIRCKAFDLYDTHIQKLEPLPDLKHIDEIVFTSPSTVQGFVHIFGCIPRDKQLRAIGPITQKALHDKINSETGV